VGDEGGRRGVGLGDEATHVPHSGWTLVAQVSSRLARDPATSPVHWQTVTALGICPIARAARLMSKASRASTVRLILAQGAWSDTLAWSKQPFPACCRFPDPSLPPHHAPPTTHYP
jgi:hypothetical protein